MTDTASWVHRHGRHHRVDAALSKLFDVAVHLVASRIVLRKLRIELERLPCHLPHQYTASQLAPSSMFQLRFRSRSTRTLSLMSELRPITSVR